MYDQGNNLYINVYKRETLNTKVVEVSIKSLVQKLKLFQIKQKKKKNYLVRKPQFIFLGKGLELELRKEDDKKDFSVSKCKTSIQPPGKTQFKTHFTF